MDQRPIGVFDSGVGGLSVVRELRRVLPGEDIVYFADQANCPYGPRATEELRGLAGAATSRLLARDAKLVVVACNTASTAALGHLRKTFVVPFVGMVPAIKPACVLTRSKKVAVLATAATLRSAAFDELIARHGMGAQIVRLACPEFVALVEESRTGPAATLAIIQAKLSTLPEAGVDQIVLGCTHFEFLQGAIEEVVGPGVHVMGAATPVAEQAARVLVQRNLLATRARGNLRLETSGDAESFRLLANRLLYDEACPGLAVAAPSPANSGA